MPPEAVRVLKRSYRSHAGLITGLNAIFASLLDPHPDPARPWAAIFSPLEAERAEPAPGFAAPHMEVHLAAGTRGDGALDRAADALVGRLVALVESGAQVRDDGALRPLDYGDVAILCRASTSFAPYEDAMERAGVPFVTVAGRGFYDRPEVRDVLNALSAISDLSDDLAVAGLLRSPAIGLTDAALYVLRERSRKALPPRALWDEVVASGASLDGADGARARRAVRVVGGLAGRVGREPVADVLKSLLDQTAYRAALVAAGQSRGARNLDKLLDDALASGIVSVSQFLQYVAERRDVGTREGEARTVAAGSVQLMSVHAAKGLEFPVVAIGDAGHESSGERGWLIDGELGLCLPLKSDDGQVAAVYTLARRRACERDDAEDRRLLYVAATRAMERLLFSGTASPGKLGLSEPSGWLQLLWPVWGLKGGNLPCADDGAEAREFVARAGEAPVRLVVYEPRWAPARSAYVQASSPERADWSLPPPLVGTMVPALGRDDEGAAWDDRRPAPRVWDVVPRQGQRETPAWVLGQIVHEALASWRLEEEGLAEWVRTRARGYGVSDEGQAHYLARRTGELLRSFRGSTLYGAMNAAPQRLHEVPYARTVNGIFERGMIDALYQTRSGWILVEFKTDAFRDDADLCQRLGERDYVGQTRRYVAAVRDALGEEPGAVLCLLNYDGRTRTMSLDEVCALIARWTPAIPATPPEANAAAQ